MSEENDKSIRRFGRRNQKDKLIKPDSLFPIEDDDSEPLETFDFDIDSLDLPDTDSEALKMLSSLHDEVKAPVITPQAERYPPIAPVAPTEQKQAQQLSTQTAQKKQGGSIAYNLLTFILFLGTILTIIWFAIVWDNPQSVLNPLPPETPFIVVTVLPDDVSAVIVDDPSQPTPDADGQIFVVITDTPAPTIVGTESPFPFVASPVLYAPNSNELGCNWWSIAGTVTDLDGNPVSGYRIRVMGDDVNETVFSGASQAFGAGGYELPLVGTPQEAVFTVQLLTAQDVPLTEETTITTRSDCDGNVTVINFIQNR